MNRSKYLYRAAVAVGIVALGLSMLACANACPAQVQQFNAGCYQQVQAVQQLQYAPIVAPVAQAFVQPVVQQYYAPPVQQFVAPPVYTQQFNAGYSAQLNVAPVAALKSRQVVRSRAVRVPRRQVVRTNQIVAPVQVAPVIGY